jgi:magnesium chelatase family protein
LSGPLLDRIDLIVNVSRVPNDILLTSKLKQDSQHKSGIELINTARKAQESRYKSSIIYNGSLSSNQVNSFLTLQPDAKQLLVTAGERLGLSARSYFKVIKVAQTIADMTAHTAIEREHIAEALQYRGVTS